MSVFRSFLFAPGNHARRVEKCLTVGADAVILDLEDAVAMAEKPATRAVVVQALQRPRRGLGYVRVNALSTEWSHGDFLAVVARGVDGIVLPKVERASDILTAEWLLASLERERGLPVGGIDLMPIVETGLGMTHLREILRAGTRVRRVAFGAGDFTLDIGLQWTAGETELLPHRSAFVVESRAAGLEPPVDTVWIRLQDAAGFEASAAAAPPAAAIPPGTVALDDPIPVDSAFVPVPGSADPPPVIPETIDPVPSAGSGSVTESRLGFGAPLPQRLSGVSVYSLRIVAATSLASSGLLTDVRPGMNPMLVCSL